jgi:hypothetical protein
MTATEILMLIQSLVVLGTGVVVVIYTIETHRLRVAAAAQLELTRRKEKRDEWRDAIRDADRLLEQHLNLLVRGKNGLISDRRTMLQHVTAEVMASKKWYDSAYADRIFAKYTDELDVAAFSGTVSLVWDIWHLLDGFAANLAEQHGNLVSFWVSYFQGVTSQLHTIGAIREKTWQDTLGPIIARLMHKAAGWSPSEADERSNARD